jgi:hypothetical protein
MLKKAQKELNLLPTGLECCTSPYPHNRLRPWNTHHYSMVAFKLLDGSETVPIGYQYVQCHMIFDVKMENFRWKARFVAGGHMTKTH